MGLINRLHHFVRLTSALASEVNAEINQLYGVLNGGIENNNVKVNAGIRQDEGKIVLDYDAIRTELYTGVLNWLDGDALLDLSVDIEKFEPPVAQTLTPTGLYTPTTWNNLPQTIAANEFTYYMVVFWQAQLVMTGSGASSFTYTVDVWLDIDGNQIINGNGGTVNYKNTVERDGGSDDNSDMISGFCIVQMSSGNDYTTDPPELARGSSHTLDIDLNVIEAGGNTVVLNNKNIVVFGR